MAKFIENMPTYADEVLHEREMAETGKHRTNKRRLAHIQREAEADTSYGKVIMRYHVSPLAQGILEYLQKCSKTTQGRPPEAYMGMAGVNPEVLALICIKHVINTIAQEKPLTATCIALGGKIATEEALKNFQYLNPELYSTVKKDLDSRSYNYGYKRRKLRESAIRGAVAWEEWSTTKKYHVGLRLIEILIETTKLVSIATQLVNKKRTKVVKPTQETKSWINKRNQWNELLSPDYLPTVMRPKMWQGLRGGGYWTKELPELNFVKTRNQNLDRELEQFDMKEVFDAVNVMQDTGYTINKFILNVMEEAWDKDLAIGGMPRRDDLPLPNKPHDINDNAESLREYKTKSVIIHTENARMTSKRILYSKILWEAKKFKNYKAIYFPLQLDFRGRAYCVPAFLNYQSITGAKALLNFAEGKEITKENKGEFWLAVQGANMWGNDKVSLNDRVAWAHDPQNMAWITDCVEDPLVCRKWEDASEPFQFLAWAHEWVEFSKVGYGFKSSLVCSIDGSCNGLQLYSLMLRDKEAGKLVNTVPSDTPQDIYQLVADNVIEKLKQDVKEGAPYSQMWLDYGVKRSTTKRSIMTICYGSTRYSCTDFVVEDMTKRKDKGEPHPFKTDMFRPATYLAGIIWDSIGDNLKSAREGMAFLQAVARIVAKEQLPIHWVTPVGFPVHQSYPEMKSKRIKAMLMGEIIKPRINEATEKTDKLKMGNGVAPNFVHSLDSAAMLKTVNIAYKNGIRNFCNVHDSFGTNAADVQTLSNSLKEAFIDIFANTDVLEDFRNDVKRQLPEELRDKLPEAPNKGELKIEDLEFCDYFFA